MLIDSHCHLDFPDFAPDLPDLFGRAKAAGVGGFLTICTHVSKFEQVHKVARDWNQSHNVWCTVGTHPHHSEEPGEQIDSAALLQAAQNPLVVGIGECGLDYYYEHSPKAEQKAAFTAQMEVAMAANLPVIVHTRDADEDMMAMLKAAGPKLRGVLHCFSSSRKLAEAALELGFYISFSGILTFNKSDDLRETAKIVPLDRVLVETDAPFLAPVPLRGKRCEPAFVAHTAAKLAEVKGVSVEEITTRTTDNFHTLFNKVERRV
jgi:TatD DNase family protein